MAAKRYYYSDTIVDFLKRSMYEIAGDLATMEFDKLKWDDMLRSKGSQSNYIYYEPIVITMTELVNCKSN